MHHLRAQQLVPFQVQAGDSVAAGRLESDMPPHLYLR